MTQAPPPPPGAKVKSWASATGPWPIPGDVPDLEAIIADQAATMAAQAKMIDDYQAVLSSAQAPVPQPPATTSIVSTGVNTTSFTTSNPVTGTIVNGAVMTDPVNNSLPPGLTVLAQVSGTPGGAGEYIASAPLNIAIPLNVNITPPSQPSGWPTPTDAPTLSAIQQDQSGVLRLQTALIQAYQDVLNDSQTPPPASGP